MRKANWRSRWARSARQATGYPNNSASAGKNRGTAATVAAVSQKSAVGHGSERKFLGHRLLTGGELGVAPQSQARLKDNLRELTRRSAGQSLREVVEQVNQKLTGWIEYFQLARMKGFMQDMGQWLRRRLRCSRLKQCERTLAIARFLMSLGESARSAWMLALSGKGWWRLADTPQAHRAMDLRWFTDTGLIDPEAVYLAVRHAC